MSDEAAFLTALKANPADDTARLVYADWLDEHDESQKAEYLRLVVQVARRDDNVAACPDGVQLCEIAKQLTTDWRSAAGSRFALVLDDYSDKIQTIKWIREVTGDGLGEAKVASETLPHALYTCAPFEMAFASYSLRPEPVTHVRIVPTNSPTAVGDANYQLRVNCSVFETPPLAQPELGRAEREAMDALTCVLAAAGVKTAEEVRAELLGQDILLVDSLTLDQARARKGELAALIPSRHSARSWYLWINRRPITLTPFTQ